MKPQTTVHVVDDEETVRRALRRLLESSGLQVKTYACAQEFLDCWTDSGRSCLVLDIRMPGMDGLSLQDALIAKEIHIPIVFVTGHGNIPMGVRAIKTGAVDFIQKPFDDLDLLDAIHRALEKDDRIRKQQALINDVRQRMALLSDPERQTMLLIVEGLPNEQIASQLGASEEAVEVHRTQVMAKMKADSIPDLVRMALAAGINFRTVQSD